MKINSQLLNSVRNTTTIREMISKKLGVSQTEITDEASFTKDLGADSIDLVELVMDLENEFGIAIPYHELDKLTTIGSLIDYINRRTRSSFYRRM